MRSAKNMTELVTDLLDLGKIEASLEGAGEPVDLVPLIADVVKALAAPAEGKHIAVGIEGPPAAAVCGVHARLQQVLTNLIGNAIKYTRDGGRVRVTVEAPEATEGPVRIRPVRIMPIPLSITIPARDLPHVF